MPPRSKLRRREISEFGLFLWAFHPLVPAHSAGARGDCHGTNNALAQRQQHSGAFARRLRSGIIC
jgi:hypothetical protein